MNPSTLILNLLAIGVLMIAWGLLWQALRGQRAARLSAAVAGAITFIVAARVLEPPMLQASGLTAWLGSSAPVPVWVIFGFALAAALFEEVGRVTGLALGYRRTDDMAAWTWSFAAGYAGAELLLIGVVGHGQFLAVAQSSDGGAALLQALPPEVRAGLQRSLAELGPISALWLLSERLAACAFQVALTLLVAAAIEARSVARFVAALALHFVIDLPAAAYQLGAVPLWLVEVAYLVAGLGALRWLQDRWQAGLACRVLPKARSLA
jgi:uncharacterized membrane protein YhfC